MHVVAYLGVVLLAIFAVLVVFGGAYCAIQYVRAAIREETWIPVRECSSFTYSIGLTYIVLFVVTVGVSFFMWSVSVVFTGC